MKKILKISVLLLAAVLIAGLAGCEEEGGAEVDFTAYNNDAAFFVDNISNYNLVAFKGSLASSNLLGGIPAKAEYHGIKKNLSIFNRTEAFPVILITEEQYIANKNRLSDLRDTPFSRIGVFYNHGMDNPQRYEISDKMGGRHTLRILNSSGLDVEIRENGPGGPTMGYATRQMELTDFPIQGGDYYLYPVFKFFNSARNVFVQSYPKRSVDGGPWFHPVDFPIAGADVMRTFDLKAAYETIVDNMTLGAAWVIIDNQSTTSSIDVQIGTEPVRDTLGGILFSPGVTRIVSIEMPGVTSDTFAASRSITNLNVGAATVRTSVKDQNDNETFTLLTDNQYTVVVTGTAATGFTATIDTSDPTPVNPLSYHSE